MLYTSFLRHVQKSHELFFFSPLFFFLSYLTLSDLEENKPKTTARNLKSSCKDEKNGRQERDDTDLLALTLDELCA